MSDKNDGGDKTEKPTPQRLDDARKKGDVAKSRELTSVAVLIVWLALASLAVGYAGRRLMALIESTLVVVAQDWGASGFVGAARALGMQSAEAAVMLVALVLVPAAAVGLLVDFLQTGPVLAFDKLTPRLENLDPVEGLRKLFTMDNLIELLKSLVKAALLALIGWWVVRAALPTLLQLTRAPELPAQAIAALHGTLSLKLMLWTVALFTGLALLDWSYQRWSFEKKMRMSLRDIRQEAKESEGDPHIKQQRRQAAQEWAQGAATQAARQASVLVVNPTHVAIAIDYDRETRPVPTVAAKGEDHVARAMREAAEAAGVPILRNVPLARTLLARADVGEIVPTELFDLIAEVILWAREVREDVEAQRAWARGDIVLAPAGPAADAGPPRRRVAAPGEDLTHYPDQHPEHPIDPPHAA